MTQITLLISALFRELPSWWNLHSLNFGSDNNPRKGANRIITHWNGDGRGMGGSSSRHLMVESSWIGVCKATSTTDDTQART